MSRLQETAAQLLGNIGEPQQADRNEGQKMNNPLSDPRLLQSVGQYFSKMNEKDSRCDFLYALKPLLRTQRRDRIDEAVSILRVTKLMELLREGNLFG